MTTKQAAAICKFRKLARRWLRDFGGGETRRTRRRLNGPCSLVPQRRQNSTRISPRTCTEGRCARVRRLRCSARRVVKNGGGMSANTNVETEAVMDDTEKVQWTSTFLTATIRSPRNYNRFQLLQKMAEVLDIIGW